MLRNITSETKKKSIMDKDVLTSILKSKYVSPYSMWIREVGADPFFVHYHSDFQLEWYKKYCKLERSVLSIDATGAVVASVIPPKDSISANVKSPNFLYLLKASTATGSSVTVGQMISQRHSALKIGEWLRLWTETVPTPKEIVMDESSALILACVQSLALCHTVGDYLQKCFDVLEGRESALPNCYIRLDISHFIKTLGRSKIFKNIDTRVKNFYMCAFGLLFWVTDFNIVKQIIFDILMVCSNPTEERKGVKFECEHARLRLCCLIETHSSAEITAYLTSNDELDDKKMDGDIEGDSNCNSEIDLSFDFYTTIKNKIVIENGGDKDNMLFLPSLIPLVDKKVKQLPFWAAVMSAKFKSDSITCSSSNCEATFRYIHQFLNYFNCFNCLF